MVSNGSMSAAEASTTVVEPSEPISTITSAESASGTRRASPSRSMPTVPRASPEAIPGSQRCFCSSRARELERESGGGVREERHRSERVPELLGEDRQLDDPESLPAVLLVDEDARPAELGHLLPGVVVVAARLGQLAHALRLEARGEQLVRGALDRLLVVGEVEVHGVYLSFGRPSTRSAMMFLRISVVPPSIEFARERSRR